MYHCRPGIAKALEDFKVSVYGENYDEDENTGKKTSNASNKRKQISEDAINKCAYYNWEKLADDGKVICTRYFLFIDG